LTASQAFKRTLTGAAVIAAALAVGLLPAMISALDGLLVCATALLVLAVLALRRALRAPARAFAGAEPPAHAPPTEAPELRMARMLFYAGSVLVGEEAFRYVGGLTLSEAAFIAAFGLCAIAALRGHRIVAIPPAVFAAAGVFVIGGALSSAHAQSQAGSAVQLVHAVYVVLLWPWVGAMVLRTRRQTMTALTLWTLSGALDGLGALAQLIHVPLPGLLPGGSRMTGFTEHPNDLGGVSAVVLVPALLLATARRPGDSPIAAALSWLAVLLVALGLALSGSVSAMAGGAVAVVVWLSSPAVRAPARLAVAVALVCSLVLLAAIAGTTVSTPIQRLSEVASPTSQNGGSVQDRLSIAAQAWPRIVRDPFVGTGLDTADSVATIVSHGNVTSYQIHGLPLAAEYQTGIFGLLGVIGLLVVLAALGWQGMASAADPAELLIGQSLLAAFVAFVTVAMVQPMVFQQYGWITGVFIVAWRARALGALQPVPTGRAELPRPRLGVALGRRAIV
jgi:O-antigen ligase